jgi:CheY-like chemotaxis protein
MSSQVPVLLIVDDTEVNQILIAEFLTGNNYAMEIASSGEEAWEMLQAAPDKYDAVLLDRMMPGIDGMEVLHRIKKDARLKLLPVILQTAVCFPEQVAEGLSAGAYYYLTKPYDRDVMRAVVATALRDRAARIAELNDVESVILALSKLNEAHFSFSTLDGARQIAGLISALCPARDAANMGLMELMLNAIEHGNLGITYDEKTTLIAEDRLQEEVRRRCALPEHAGKVATINFRREDKKLLFTIQDAGKGFDWMPFLEMSMARVMDNHGRGIAMSRMVSFTSLEYRGNGNCVDASITLPAGSRDCNAAG